MSSAWRKVIVVGSVLVIAAVVSTFAVAPAGHRHVVRRAVRTADGGRVTTV